MYFSKTEQPAYLLKLAGLKKGMSEHYHTAVDDSIKLSHDLQNHFIYVNFS